MSVFLSENCDPELLPQIKARISATEYGCPEYLNLAVSAPGIHLFHFSFNCFNMEAPPINDCFTRRSCKKIGYRSFAQSFISYLKGTSGVNGANRTDEAMHLPFATNKIYIANVIEGQLLSQVERK